MRHVIISVLASALTAAAVYLLCRRYADRALAVVIALGAASAPLVWTYGEVAMPYALLGLLSVGLAASLRDARSRAWPAALLASAGLGLTAGLRQDVLLLLGPLWLWMILARPWRDRALCLPAGHRVSHLVRAALSVGRASGISGTPAVMPRASATSRRRGGDALLRTRCTITGALVLLCFAFAGPRPSQR